jgi:hypothetical protein
MKNSKPMRYKILITIILFLAVQTGWSADQKEKKSDDKTQQMPPNPAEGVVYALPRTVLSVQVKLVKETFRTGPYALFAEKYLGYPDVRTSNSENWTIVAIDVVCRGEADPDAVFKTFGTSATLVSLYPDGSLSGINSRSGADMGYIKGDDLISYSEIPTILFSDQSSNDQYDIVVNAETGGEKMKMKTLEDKAREAADYLFRIRQKRVYAILSPSDIVPEDGKGYEVFVQQAEKIEKEYVSLFLGKSFKSEHEVAINFTPGQESVKGEVLFRFSDEKGILPKTDISGKPFTIEMIKDQKHYSSIESAYQPTGPNSGRSGLFYRIPVNASLTISEGYNILYQGRLPVAQFGLISPVPELLINNNTSIEFDKVTGAIRCSENNQ